LERYNEELEYELKKVNEEIERVNLPEDVE
jgi:hypothetical protein